MSCKLIAWTMEDKRNYHCKKIKKIIVYHDVLNLVSLCDLLGSHILSYCSNKEF